MSTVTLTRYPFPSPFSGPFTAPRKAPASADRWVQHVLAAPATGPGPESVRPSAEISKDGDDAVIRLDLPGIDVENDVTVELDNGHLVVRGERRDAHAEADHSLREVRYGAFRRSFAVPSHVTGEAVTASYDAGVLTVRVTGVHASSQPQRIAINT